MSSTHQNNFDDFYGKDYFSPSPKSMSFQSSSVDDPMSDIGNINDEMFTRNSVDYSSVNNANLLRDIESLIQSMEQKQTQDESESTMLRNIDDILSNIKLNESRPHSPQSNLSAEPIRVKSPIMMVRSGSGGDKSKVNDVHDIKLDVRSFVSNNIQEILPDLVDQVKSELTSSIEYDFEEFFDASEQDDYFRHRHDEEFQERLNSPLASSPGLRAIDDLLESHLEDFLRSRHEEEFNERNSPSNFKLFQDDDNVEDQNHVEFLRQRHDEEYFEINNDETPQQQQQRDESQQTSSELKDNNDESTISNAAWDLEPLKFKSSYNLKILRKHSKRTKREKDFKRRNSLILENVLLGRQETHGEQSRESSVISQSISLAPDTPDSSDFETLNNSAPSHNADERNINHESLITEATPGVIQSEINASEWRARDEIDIQHRESTTAENNINDNVVVPNETPASEQQPNNGNEVQARTIETVVEIIINDEMGAVQQHEEHYIINDSTATFGEGQDVFDDSSSFTTPIPQSSSSFSITSIESDSIRTPQNLSELVEDTQRLIKQMKDEINAIYVSDDDEELSGSEYTDEDNWENSFEEEEYESGEEEESEYEDDWSGEFIESPANEETLIEVPLTEATNEIIGPDETLNINRTEEIQQNESAGSDPSEVNEPIQAIESESVVHGKLELTLTTVSTNQYKVDASNVESEISDANESNSSVSAASGVDLAAPSTAEEKANEISETQLPSTSSASFSANEAINNEIIVGENSIKAIVNEAAISECISTISFDETENIVSRGNDDNHSEIALSALPTSSPASDRQDDGANVDSVMNNSAAEVMPKVSGSSNETELNHDASSAIQQEIINSSTSAMSGAATAVDASMESESAEMLSNDEKSESVKNDVGAEYAREDMQMAQSITQQEQRQSDESQKSLIISVDVEQRANEEVIAMRSDLPLHKAESPVTNSTQDNNQPATSSKGAKSKIPSKTKAKSKENSRQLSEEAISKDEESKGKSTKTRKTSVDNTTAKKSTTAPVNDAATRKKSIGSSGSPFGGLLGTTNVKSLQSQFLNKATTSSAATTVKPQITKLKPSKLVPPKILSKEAPSTFANKLTKLITPSINEKDAKQTVAEVKGSNEQKMTEEEKEGRPLKDHSKATVPKKKYMEHCFSDEYSTTTDDDEDDIKISPQHNLFTLPKKPNRDSDDETSDVRERYASHSYHLFS